MCGLFGVIGNIDHKALEVFERLALISVFRGSHSTGIAVVRKDDTVSVYKKPVPTYDFMEMSEPKRLLQNPYTIKCIIGHARYATIGGKTASNAHPFEFDNIVGAHNGTIDRLCISQYLDPDAKFGTDSEAIFSKLNDEDYDEVFPKLEGAWAVTAWDKEHKVLNILRNEKRDLFCLYSRDSRTMFWASEYNMLAFAVTNAKYEYKPNKDSHEPQILIFSNDHMYTITDRAILTVEKEGYASKAKYLPKATTYTPFTPPAVHNSANGTHVNHRMRYDDSNLDAKKGDTGFTTVNGSRPKDASFVRTLIAPLIDEDTKTALHKAADHTFFDIHDFVKDYDQECQLCNGEIDFNVGMMITAEEPFKPICHKCVEKEPHLLNLAEIV